MLKDDDGFPTPFGQKMLLTSELYVFQLQLCHFTGSATEPFAETKAPTGYKQHWKSAGLKLSNTAYHLCNIEGTCPTEYVLSTDPDIYNKNKIDVSEWHEELQTVVRTMNNDWYQKQSGAKV